MASIAHTLLLHTPAYRGRDSLPLQLPGDIRYLLQSFEFEVVLFASTANQGSTSVATELQKFGRQPILHTRGRRRSNQPVP